MDIENVLIKFEQPDDDDCNVVEEQIDIKHEVLECTNETPYKCGICGHRTTTDTLLKVHMKMHLVKRVHQCNICKKTFSFVTELNSHILTHTEEKNSYQCEVCGRDCFTEEDLHKHYRVHTKEKPFKCKLCFRSFSDDSYLRIHERSHHGEDYLTTVMKKNGTYVDPNLVRNIIEDTSIAKVSVQRTVMPKRRFKNNPNLPLNNEEKRMLLQFVAELGLNKKYAKLERIKSYLKSGWTKMVGMFAEHDYDRNSEKLARTYFHLKNQAKTHLERFYKYKKLPEPHEIDYMFVKLCPNDLDIPGIDMQQVIEDSKKFCIDESFEDKNKCLLSSSEDEMDEKTTEDDLVARVDGMSEDILDKSEPSVSGKRNLQSEDGPPCKIKKCENEEISTDVDKLRLKFVIEEEKRREQLYKLEVHQKQQLFEMDKRHREEIFKKEMEIKDLELRIIRKKLENYFLCDICQKCFSNEEFLKLHIENHLNREIHHDIFGSEDPFSDTVLPSDISDKYLENCRTTLPIENKDPRSFECEHTDKNGKKCSRRFGEQEAYNIHVKNHEDSIGAQQVFCHLCKAKFTDNSELSVHVQGLHKSFERSATASDDNISSSKEIAKGKGKIVFKCTICSKHFPVPSKLRSHMRTHTGEKPFKCDICNKSFGTAGSLKDHGYLHTNDRPFKCTICEKGFTKNSALEDHIRSHTGERPYECNICKKRYRTVVILNQHLLAHAKEKPFKCDVCNKSFIYLCNLKYHMIMHTGTKPFACKLCDKSYALKSALKIHMMDHTGEKPHKCRFCEKQFTAVNSLKKHERVHTGEKPYLCSICQRGFSQSSSLSRHLDSHKGEKPYRCHICQKGLTSSSYLKIHIKMHKGEAPYQCSNCKETFISAKKYKAHLKQHKGDINGGGSKSRTCKLVNDEGKMGCVVKMESDEDMKIKKELE